MSYPSWHVNERAELQTTHLHVKLYKVLLWPCINGADAQIRPESKSADTSSVHALLEHAAPTGRANESSSSLILTV